MNILLTIPLTDSKQSLFLFASGEKEKKLRVLECYIIQKLKAWFLTAGTKLTLNGLNFTFIYLLSLSGF